MNAAVETIPPLSQLPPDRAAAVLPLLHLFPRTADGRVLLPAAGQPLPVPGRALLEIKITVRSGPTGAAHG